MTEWNLHVYQTHIDSVCEEIWREEIKWKQELAERGIELWWGLEGIRIAQGRITPLSKTKVEPTPNHDYWTYYHPYISTLPVIPLYE